MHSARRAGLVLLSAVGIGLWGCGSLEPNIVLHPALPAVAPSAAPGSRGAVSLDTSEAAPSKYEEKGDRTQLGRSESLGVHMSDFWVDEAPEAFIGRLLQSDLAAWGFQVSPGEQRNRLRARVNRFALDSKAANAVEFQADGVIDVDLEVDRADGTRLYKANYVGTCTRRSATEFPNRENMEKVFRACVDDFQKRLEADAGLRDALSSN